MTVRIIGCFLLMVAVSAVLGLDPQLPAAAVMPNLDEFGVGDSPTSSFEKPRGEAGLAQGVDAVPLRPYGATPWHSPPYTRQPSVRVARPSLHAPPRWTSPWSRGYLASGAPAYDGLPPVPTAPQYEAAHLPFGTQPRDQNWVPSPTALAPAVPQAPIRKPFSSYGAPPAISPYLFLNQDDPDWMIDYYLIRPLLEKQELDQP